MVVPKNEQRRGQARATGGKGIGHALQLSNGPRVPMSEQALRAIRRRAWFGVHEVVAGADEEAKVPRRALKLNSSSGIAELLCQTYQRVGDSACGSFFQILYASRLEPFAAQHSVPLEGRETVNSQAKSRRISRIYGDAGAVMPQGWDYSPNPSFSLSATLANRPFSASSASAFVLNATPSGSAGGA